METHCITQRKHPGPKAGCFLPDNLKLAVLLFPEAPPMAIFSRPDMYSGHEAHPIAMILLHIRNLQESAPLNKRTYHHPPQKDTLNSHWQVLEVFSLLLPRYNLPEFQTQNPQVQHIPIDEKDLFIYSIAINLHPVIILPGIHI